MVSQILCIFAVELIQLREWPEPSCSIKAVKTMTTEEILRKKSKHYLHCFNIDCARHNSCLCWLVAQHTEKTDINILSVNPMNPDVKAGNCMMYRENVKVNYARGMVHFYDQMTSKQERAIKKRLIATYSRKPYYEYRNGIRPIGPEMQKNIARICREEGYTAELQYDSWEEDFLW